MKTLIKNNRKIDISEGGEIFSHAYVDGRGRKRNAHKLSPVANSKGYLHIKLTHGKQAKTFGVHRLIAEAYLDDYAESLFVDHVDGNPRNNSIKNLRMVSHAGNQKAHRTDRAKTTSKYRGVSWNKSNQKWKVRFNDNKKVIYVGCFKDETEAAKAWNKVAVENGYFPEALNKIPA